MLYKRVISALAALPLLFIVVVSNLNIFFGALFTIAMLGLYEYFHALEFGNVKPMKATGMIAGIIIMAIIFNKDNLQYLLPFIVVLVIILLSIPVLNTRYNFYGAGATLIGVLYIPLIFGYIYFIRSIPDKGVFLVWFVFICSWITDTSAYFAGRAFGKRKLCPKVSPKKTIEGSIGGIIGSTTVCLLYGAILNSLGITAIPLFHFLIIGILGSVFSQFGDLAASSIKRNVGIKDYGHIMPGHGGILDRFDSILFVAPLIYYYITFIM